MKPTKTKPPERPFEVDIVIFEATGDGWEPRGERQIATFSTLPEAEAFAAGLPTRLAAFLPCGEPSYEGT